MDKKSPSYPPLAVDGGFLIFSPVAVIEDEGKPDPEMGVGVSFFDCSTGVEKLISRLPFVADPGEVKDAFLTDAGTKKNMLFIIHSAPIRAFTGVSYGSDYFSVMAFSRKNKEFLPEKRLTDYFGAGADVVVHGEDSDVPIYTYPYKTRDKIINGLSSERYQSWNEGGTSELVVAHKSTIYSSMSIADPTKMYLIKGDKVTRESISAGWIAILYKTVKNKSVRGWVLCGDVNDC